VEKSTAQGTVVTTVPPTALEPALGAGETDRATEEAEGGTAGVGDDGNDAKQATPCCELLKLDERATGNGLGTMLYNLTTHSKAERKAQPAEGTPASPTTTVEALEAEEVGAKGVAEEKSTEHGAAQMPVSSTAAATALETALGAAEKDRETEDEV